MKRLRAVETEPWFGVEIRHLSALVAVAREESFRGAADRLGYVQSAVSHQVATLERIVGSRLVERYRGSKEVHLTPAGELLVSHAQQILAGLYAARADLASHSDQGEEKTLRVGVCQSVATGLLPHVLPRLTRLAPEVRVVPIEADDDALAELLEQGSLDAALADLALDPASFDAQPIISDPCVLLVRSDSEWTGRSQAPTASELAEIPLIALDGWRFLASVEAWFSAQGRRPNFVLRARNEATVRAFVSTGLGAAIVPSLGVEETEGITAVDLAEVLPARRVSLHWPSARQHQPGLGALLEATKVIAERICARRPVRPAMRSEAPAALAAA